MKARVMKARDILPDAPAHAVVPPTDKPSGVWDTVGLSAWEYGRITDLLGREPNALELELFGVMWSEHCSYKNTRALLRRLPTEGPRVVQGPGENAGAIRVGDKTVVFKIESHNHPSAVEPFHGAATGVGGILRDIFTMGARPVAVLDSLRFGPLDEPRQRELLAGVVDGIADYAGVMEVPAVASEVRFDPSYTGNCLVNAMAIGVQEGPLAKGLAAGPGNPVIVFGRPTGRDGVRSASFASQELTEGQNIPLVPHGDPHTEKRLLAATLELLQSDVIVGMQDMGAAGFISSSCEMAARAGTGIEIDVSRVPKVDSTIQPFEVMLSETQERMLAVVQRGREAEVGAVLERHGLTWAVCGAVTDDGLVRVRDGEAVLAEVPARLLADEAPCYVRPLAAAEPGETAETAALPEPSDWGEVLQKLLSSPQLGSRAWLRQQYGAPGEAGVSAAAVVDLGGDGDETAIAVCTYGNGRHVFLDPYTGTQGCVAAAARKVAATGAEPAAITNGLNFGSPEKPEIYWQLERSLTGMADACRELGTPVTGGNASLFNETDGVAIFPTPIIGMVGVLPRAEAALEPGFQRSGDAVLLLGATKDELGGSEYVAIWHGQTAGEPPAPDLAAERRLYSLMQDAAGQGLLVAAHAVANGGLAVALSEMAFAAATGADGFDVTLEPGLSTAAALFSETHGRIVVEVAPGDVAAVMALAEKAGVPCRQLGEVHGGVARIAAADGTAVVDKATADVASGWKEAIPCRMT